jgi:hypothetical protein
MAIVQQPNLNMHNKIYDSRTEFGATPLDYTTEFTAEQNLEQHKII